MKYDFPGGWPCGNDIYAALELYAMIAGRESHYNSAVKPIYCRVIWGLNIEIAIFSIYDRVDGIIRHWIYSAEIDLGNFIEILPHIGGSICFGCADGNN